MFIFYRNLQEEEEKEEEEECLYFTVTYKKKMYRTKLPKIISV